MTNKKPKKRNRKTFRSMGEFKEHYFPNPHEDEKHFKRKEGAEDLGASMAEEFLERIRRELQRAK